MVITLGRTASIQLRSAVQVNRFPPDDELTYDDMPRANGCHMWRPLYAEDAISERKPREVGHRASEPGGWKEKGIFLTAGRAACLRASEAASSDCGVERRWGGAAAGAEGEASSAATVNLLTCY